MIRKARQEDADQLIGLMAIIWQDMDFEPYRKLPWLDFKQVMSQHILNSDDKYSYHNCWVYEEEAQIQGLLLGYDGAKETVYDRRIVAQFQGFPQLRNFHLSRESLDDEWYIDMIVVSQSSRGKGIGQMLLESLDHWHAPGTRLGLNCDTVNDRARSLYQRQGFITTGLVTFSGHHYDHMQKITQ